MQNSTYQLDDVWFVRYPSNSALFASSMMLRWIVHQLRPIDLDSMVATASPAQCSAAADIHSLDQLREFVHLMLCRRENLLEFHFPMSEVELKKNGTLCGIQFVLHGPRRVKLTAVWAADRNEILMYTASGRRFSRFRLPNPVA
ncbi:MAG: hypothetical protein MK102_15265 [Fuerstiella sp.]|nr:hypothetical protein [Fuerstiella sp.]